MGLVNKRGFERVTGAFLSHDLNVGRLDVKANQRADFKSVVVLDHKLISVRRLHKHLVVDTFEDAGLDRTGKLGAVGLGHNVNVFRSYHHINRNVLAEVLVDAFELHLHKFDAVIVYHTAVEYGRFADKIRHEGVARLVVYIRRGTYLLNASLIEHNNRIRKRQRLFLVVCDINEGYAHLLMQFLELNLHILSHLEVKRCKRFVEKEHLRIIHERTRNGYPLLLTARKRFNGTVVIVGHAHHLEHLLHTLVDLILREFLKFQAECDIVVHVKVRKERIALEDRVERSLVRRDGRDVLALEQNASRIGSDEAGNLAQQGCLSAARRSEEGDEFAPAHIQIYVLQHLFVTEGLAKVLDIDDYVVCHRLETEEGEIELDSY